VNIRRWILFRSPLRKIFLERKFKNLSNKEIFEKIYRENLWGKSKDGSSPFFSGYGSHKKEIIQVYIDSVNGFLDSLGEPKVLIDLGCGDFNVGAKIVPKAKRYIGCDVVPGVIEHNKLNHSIQNVEIKVLDFVNDDLPNGDVYFVRFVLQHLSNKDIRKFCSRVKNYCSYLILTEHLPLNKYFRANIDKPSGSDIRLQLNSGIVLTKKPFKLVAKSENVLCEIVDHVNGGLIRTTLFSF
jgi:hypothetical protein